MNDEAVRIKQRLRDWIIQHASRPVTEGVRDDTLILEQRIITSLQLMELIMFIEQTAGRPLQVSTLQAGSFRSIDRIYQVFFARESVPEHAHAAT